MMDFQKPGVLTTFPLAPVPGFGQNLAAHCWAASRVFKEDLMAVLALWADWPVVNSNRCNRPNY